MQYIWQHRLFDHTKLVTTDGRKLRIIDNGQLNTDSGPDFFNAKISIDGCVWAGACRAGPAGTAEKAADDAGFHAAERAEKREARPPAAFRAGRKARAAKPAQLSGGPPGPARFSFDPSAGGGAEDAA